MKAKGIAIIAVIGIAVVALIVGGISLTKNIGKSSNDISKADAEKSLKKVMKDIEVTEIKAKKEAVEYGNADPKEELPKISKYPMTVKGSGDLDAEIMASPEKAGQGDNGWLIEMAKAFNQKGHTIGGKSASVSIRKFDSGTMVDYISTGKYVPDGISPSNVYWGKMIEAKGVKCTLVTDRLAGNVPGVVIEKKKYEKLVDKYGSINMKAITKATAEGNLDMGYTNPFASSTGLNFLVQTLYSYNAKDILNDKAIKGFDAFQKNVPFVSFTTMQMQDAALSGSLEAFVMEYQSYVKEGKLKRNYKFVPFGVRHDSPVYTVGNISSEKKEVIKQFTDFCKTKENQEKAKKYGFNGLDNYKSESPDFDGETLAEAQQLWKENKDGGVPIMAVFVADISGSMDGKPLKSLKDSLVNSMQYINKDNYVGLVSYNDNVNINLPIKKFDLNQQAYFKGGVNGLTCGGGTATFDGIAVGADMIRTAMEDNPKVKPMLFVLSDGDSNVGHSLEDVSGILGGYKIPVYTIGYNANIDALKEISAVNEAASINADTEDVIYKLKNLFNAEL